MGYYEVKPNQTLAEVRLDAAPHLSVFEVKEHERNKALFALRNEFQLRTGDSIWIPDEKPQPRWFSVTAGQSVKFVTTQPKRPFKLVVSFPDGRPAASQSYTLLVDGLEITGATDSEGNLEAELPVTATRGTLRMSGFAQAISIGGLEPLQTPRGVQGRLANLGYAPGPIDGKIGPQSMQAIRAFQFDEGLEMDGIVGPKTRAALEARFGF